MDVMDKLREMMEESDKSLPYVPDHVRQDLDFTIVPEMVYNNGQVFIENCLNWKEEFFCDLFNQYYEKMKPICCRDDAKLFKANDFFVGHREISYDKNYIVVSLPDEFMGSREFCRAYVITYTEHQGKKEHIQFFAITDSAYGWSRIYRIAQNGNRIILGHPTGKMSEDIELIMAVSSGI